MNFPLPHPFVAGALFLLIIIGSILIGFFVSVRRKSQSSTTSSPLGSVVGAVFGLLAFTLAFTFNIAANRFDARKSLVLDEANALGTLYLRAGLLASPYREQSTPLIREYIENRATFSRQADMLPRILKESERLHQALWDIAIEIAKESSRQQVNALYIDALNTMIDLHSSRVAVALQHRIPPFVWMILLLISALGMVGVGIQYGVVGKLSWSPILILALAFTGVVMLIADLDNQNAGLLEVKQTPIEELYGSITGATVTP